MCISFGKEIVKKSSVVPKSKIEGVVPVVLCKFLCPNNSTSWRERVQTEDMDKQRKEILRDLWSVPPIHLLWMVSRGMDVFQSESGRK